MKAKKGIVGVLVSVAVAAVVMVVVYLVMVDAMADKIYYVSHVRVDQPEYKKMSKEEVKEAQKKYGDYGCDFFYDDSGEEDLDDK